jgi:hypothetical protein
MKAHQPLPENSIGSLSHKKTKIGESFCFYRDGTLLSNVPEELTSTLEHVGAIVSIGKNESKRSLKSESVKLCGVLQSKGIVHVFLPKCYPSLSLSSDIDKKSTVKSLLSCITEYCVGNRGSSYSAITEAGEVGSIELFPLFREILLDYMRNGLYNTQETYKRHGTSGKIDWKRTVSSILPVNSQSGIPVYPRFVTKKFSHSTSSLISSIHAAIVNTIDESFGWWLTNKASGRIAPELNGCSIKNEDISRFVLIVKKELSVAYYDRDIRLLKNIIFYLESDPYPSVNGIDIRGVRDFAPIWEHMLDKVLRPKAQNLIEAMPVPTYTTQDGAIEYLKRKSGRLDTLIQKDNLVAVVDAKYYNAHSPQRAPGWPDMVKQFFYVKILQTLSDKYKIGSFFIMPLSQSNKSPTKGYIGKKIDGNDASYDQLFPPIICVYICPAELIDYYIHNKLHTELRKKLFSQISLDKSINNIYS